MRGGNTILTSKITISIVFCLINHQELRINTKKFINFYNYKRPHQSLKYLTPDKYIMIDILYWDSASNPELFKEIKILLI